MALKSNEKTDVRTNFKKITNKKISKSFKKCHIDKFIYTDDGRFIFLGRSITSKVILTTEKDEIKLHICNKEKTIIELIDISEMKNFKIDYTCNPDKEISMYSASFEYFHVKYKVTFFE